MRLGYVQFGSPCGSRVKYPRMLGRFADVDVSKGISRAVIANTRKKDSMGSTGKAIGRRIGKPLSEARPVPDIDPDYAGVIVMGDGCTNYKKILAARVPYILIENDVAAMRRGSDGFSDEQEMIENAAAMILTSEDHFDWLDERYTLPEVTEVIHLRPIKEDLKFEPLPKLKGKHIVYAGGIVDSSMAGSPYDYRLYQDIFTALMNAGWTVHVYPAHGCQDRISEYKKLGCVMHPEVPEFALYKELSQFQAGFQGYATTGAQDYIKTCRPNKLWLYLGAGIPTLGFNTGTGGDIYDGKWGVVANVLSDIPRASKAVLGMKISRQRQMAQVMDKDADAFKRIVGAIKR